MAMARVDFFLACASNFIVNEEIIDSRRTGLVIVFSPVSLVLHRSGIPVQIALV